MKTVLMWDAFQGLRGAWQLAIRLAWGQRLRSATDADFETVYQQCVRCCRAFLEKAR